MGPPDRLPSPTDHPGMPAIRWGLGDVVVGIALYFLSQALVVGVIVAVIAASGGSPVAGGNGELLLLALTVPSGWAVMVGWPLWLSRTKGTGSAARDFGLAMRPTDLLVGVGGGVVALAISAAMSLGFEALRGEDAPTNTDILAGDLNSFLVVLVLVVIVAIGTPIAEEVFFRGLVLGAARKRWGTVAGVASSSVIFGAFHVQTEPLAWLFIGAVTAGYGVVFALVRVWTQGRLAASVVAHMVVNGVAVLVVVTGP